MNPYGPEIQSEFCCFSRENDLNSEKRIYECPPDRYVPNSSSADSRKATEKTPRSSHSLLDVAELPLRLAHAAAFLRNRLAIDPSGTRESRSLGMVARVSGWAGARSEKEPGKHRKTPESTGDLRRHCLRQIRRRLVGENPIQLAQNELPCGEV